MSAKEAPAAEKLPVPVMQTKDASPTEPNTPSAKADPKIEKGQVIEAKGKAERATPDPVCIGFFDFVNNITPIALVVAIVCGAVVLVKKMDSAGSAEVVAAASTATGTGPVDVDVEAQSPEAKPEEAKPEVVKAQEAQAEESSSS